jgi:hypothetical protein
MKIGHMPCSSNLSSTRRRSALAAANLGFLAGLIVALATSCGSSGNTSDAGTGAGGSIAGASGGGGRVVAARAGRPPDGAAKVAATAALVVARAEAVVK